MNQLLEWSPLLAFFLVFKLSGIYWATAALMVACLIVLFVHRASTGKYKTVHAITAIIAVVLGAATLLLHDKRFIQWKPTVLLALAAVAFLASNVIGKQPLARRMLEGVFSEPAALNIWVARSFPEHVWVNFKVFGITAAMMLFMIPQVLWLNGKTKAAPGQT